MNHTVAVSGDLYSQEYRKSVKEIYQTLSEIVDKTSVFTNKDRKIYYLKGLSDKIQCLDFDNRLSRVIVDCLVAQSFEVFGFAPFFNDFSIWNTLSLMKEQSVFPKIEDEIVKSIQKNTEITTRKDILRFISDASSHSITNIIIEEAFNSIGLTGKVFVENSKSDKTTIEIKDAYSFDIETFDNFFFEKSIWTHSLVSIIVIDGIVESVSEINNLLEHASKNVEPMIIVARGFGDEVLQTLYVNMQRKTLNVFPVKLLNDESSINSFVDIAVVSKTDPVSYLKGNLISSIDVDNISVVEKAEIRTGKMTLVNREAAAAVYRHLDRLRKDANRKKETLDVMGVDALNNVMTGRMKSLSGRSIQLSLSKDTTSKDIHDIKIEIDSAFRTIPHARDFGMVEVSGFIKDLKKNKDISHERITVIETFFGKFKKIPAGSLIRCVKACHNNANLLNKTSGALLYEESQK